MLKRRAGFSRRSAAVPELPRRVDLGLNETAEDLALLVDLRRRAMFDPREPCSEKHGLGAVSGASMMFPLSLNTREAFAQSQAEVEK